MKLALEGAGASEAAVKAVEGAGGSVLVVPFKAEETARKKEGTGKVDRRKTKRLERSKKS